MTKQVTFYLDIETTADGGPKGDSPNAEWSVNYPLLIGWYNDHSKRYDVFKDFNLFLVEVDGYVKQGYEITLVGHNIAFDLKYFLREQGVVDWLKDVTIHDTMVWDYIDSGFTDKMLSLEDSCRKHGVQFKKSLDLGAMLQAGLKMQDIPEQDLKDYLYDDVMVLVKLHKKQDRYHWMQHIVPLAEAELNGFPIDYTLVRARNTYCLNALDRLNTNIQDIIKLNFLWQDGSNIIDEDFVEELGTKSKTIKPFASRTLSFILFGVPSELKITPKWRVKPNNWTPLNPKDFNLPPPDESRGYPMSEKELHQLEAATNIAKWALSQREHSKLSGTYYVPFIERVKCDGDYPWICPSYNTAVTSTGRLSSSNPNGQNMPEPVRKCIRGIGGKVVEELDFKQLEVVGAATLSKCPHLIRALNNGLDIHEQTAAKVFGLDKAEEMRKLAKNVNFGVLYGGKANGLSNQTGVDKGTIQQLIDAFYTNYPGVAKWQRSTYEDVIDAMEPYDIKDGEQRYASSVYFPEAKMHWKFVETNAPQWVRAKTRRKFNFSPQHTANYPIQGFAGFGLVMYALRYIWERLPPEAHIILTVHDSIVILKDEGVDLRPIYDDCMEYLKDLYNLPVPLEYDVETGKYWR